MWAEIFWILSALILVFGFVVFRGAPYVPSHRRQVEKAFSELRPLTEKDTVIDVGSGDGIILRLASKKGARVIGYELNPILVVISQLLSRHDRRVRVYLKDFWGTSFPPETTLVYGFMVERDMKKMGKKLQAEANRLQHSLEFISYGSTIPDKATEKVLGAHHLYKFEPLQGKEA